MPADSNDEIRLDIECDHDFQPKAIGRGRDERYLGVVVRSVSSAIARSTWCNGTGFGQSFERGASSRARTAASLSFRTAASWLGVFAIWRLFAFPRDEVINVTVPCEPPGGCVVSRGITCVDDLD